MSKIEVSNKTCDFDCECQDASQCNVRPCSPELAKIASEYSNAVEPNEKGEYYHKMAIDHAVIYGFQKATEAQKQSAMSLEELLNKHNIDAGSRGKEKLVAFAQEYANQFREAHNPNNDRINNYARHQFNRSALGLTLVPFEEWSAEAP